MSILQQLAKRFIHLHSEPDPFEEENQQQALSWWADAKDNRARMLKPPPVADMTWREQRARRADQDAQAAALNPICLPF